MVLESPNMEYDLRRKIQIAIEKTIRRLNMMQERSPIAKSGLEILTICLERMLKNDSGVLQPQVLEQIERSREVIEEKDHTTIGQDDIVPQSLNDFEAQPTNFTAQDPPTTVSGINFHNFEMDTSFWDEMNQMTDFDIGVSMKENLWNLNNSYLGLDMPSCNENSLGTWHGGI